MKKTRIVKKTNYSLNRLHTTLKADGFSANDVQLNDVANALGIKMRVTLVGKSKYTTVSLADGKRILARFKEENPKVVAPAAPVELVAAPVAAPISAIDPEIITRISYVVNATRDENIRALGAIQEQLSELRRSFNTLLKSLGEID